MEHRQKEFEALVHAYSKELYRYAYWLCNNHPLAEDMVQETFVRAWKALHTLHDARAAKAWLITIMRRELARYYKKNPPINVSLDESDYESSASHQPLNSTQHFILNRAIWNLPVEYREPLLLQVIAGYSCNEIASILNIKAGAVMTRTHRARQKLRDMLGDEDKASAYRNKELL